MIPSEWSSGEAQRLGSITKVRLGPIRRIMVEAVWRMKGFQPHYEPFQKWRAVLEGQNRARKKKAVVAIGRQLAVDLWRLKTDELLPSNSSSSW
jgi:transposase